MESNKAFIGALLFIVFVVGANFVLYAIARGAARSNKKGFFETISKSLNVPSGKNEQDPIDELRRKVQELNERKKSDEDVSNK